MSESKLFPNRNFITMKEQKKTQKFTGKCYNNYLILLCTYSCLNLTGHNLLKHL